MHRCPEGLGTLAFFIYCSAATGSVGNLSCQFGKQLDRTTFCLNKLTNNWVSTYSLVLYLKKKKFLTGQWDPEMIKMVWLSWVHVLDRLPFVPTHLESSWIAWEVGVRVRVLTNFQKLPWGENRKKALQKEDYFHSIITRKTPPQMDIFEGQSPSELIGKETGSTLRFARLS